MKGPVEPSVARKNIRKLLAETILSISETNKVELDAFRLEAADSIMAKYSNHTLKIFWVEWNAAHS